MRAMVPFPTVNRVSFRRSRMHVLRGVLRVGVAVASSGTADRRPFQSSLDDTEVSLCFFIHANVASPNFDTL